jgi:glycosyltransferase involved in cell wall biosynthesis
MSHMEPIRVLTIIDSLVPGGAERSLEALAPEYRARGISMDVAYLHSRPGIQASLKRAGCRLYDLSGSGGRIGWFRRALSLMRETKPDLVHTTLFEANIAGRSAARVASIPVVTSLVSENYSPEHINTPRLRRWRVRACQAADAATSQLAVRFHANSHHTADVMASRLLVPRNRIDVVNRGRDPATLGTWSEDRRLRARASLSVSPRQQVVLAGARHEHQKGLDLLIRAFARLDHSSHDVTLVVAGREGNATPQLQQAIQSTGVGDRIKLLGHRDDLAELMCGADLFVLPSRWEGFPGVLLEAMALECPIVSHAVPGAGEVLGSNGSATFIEIGDTEGLAAAVRDLLADPSRRRAQAVAAAARFRERFTIGAVADEMVSFYHRALGQARAG